MAFVLIVHRYIWPSDASTYAAMLRDIAELHGAEGDRVAICTAFANKAEAAARQDWADAEGIQLHHTELAPDRGRTSLSRLGAMLRFSAFALRVALQVKPDAITVTSYPILTPALPLAIWAKATGRRVLFHVQDIFAQNLITTGGASRVIGRLLHRLERMIVRRADVVVTLSADMKKSLGDDTHIVERQNYTPTDGAILSPQRDAPLFVYAGNLGALQNLLHFINAATQARKIVPFRILLLGGGSMAETLHDKITRKGLDFIEMRGPVSRDEAAQIVADCDIGVVSAQAHLFSYAYPSKVFTYWASGLPALVMTETDSQLAAELERDGLAAQRRL